MVVSVVVVIHTVVIVVQILAMVVVVVVAKVVVVMMGLKVVLILVVFNHYQASGDDHQQCWRCIQQTHNVIKGSIQLYMMLVFFCKNAHQKMTKVSYQYHQLTVIC